MRSRRPVDLQRLHHVDGELLRSRDLRDQLSGDLELHWWHQRAVHRAFGVALGLDVSGPEDGAVTVQAGLAYDARGHELVLGGPAAIAVPETDDRTALVLRTCPHAARAELAWVAVARVDPCCSVPLAILETDGTLAALNARARSVSGPRVGWGSTPPGSTPWQVWLPLFNRGLGFGLQVRIDTSAAGFTDVPCYFAWLQWPRLTAVLPVEYRMLGLQYVMQEAIDSFTFRVMVIRPGSFKLNRFAVDPSDAVLGLARSEQLHVCWLGVQCDGDVPTGA